MNANSRNISTKNGGTIHIVEAGQPNGVPILVHNGTPGSRLLYHPWVKDAESRGIRLISYDRPGYGGPLPSQDVPSPAQPTMSPRLQRN
jgi:pimeloyl-ACP methyl ester carboxylesterase